MILDNYTPFNNISSVMKKYLSVLIYIVNIFITMPLFAADIEMGRNRAAVCTACHGYKGISANDEWPNLAGQKTGYLVQQLKAFRDGSRNDPLMSSMAIGLSDKDIEDIATYYNNLSLN